MRIQEHFLDKPIRIWMVILLLGVGGIYALLNIGRLEDPLFTIKSAVIVTHYPGASAQQVEEEVTLPLENALQRLPSLDNVTSISGNGLSQITVNIHTPIWPISCRKSGMNYAVGSAMRPGSSRLAFRLRWLTMISAMFMATSSSSTVKTLPTANCATMPISCAVI